MEVGLAGLDTAFKATYGSGKPVIGFLAEYDALTDLSQKAGVSQKAPITPGGNGHGCGHNLLGAGSLIGALGLKKYLESEDGRTAVQVSASEGTYAGDPGRGDDKGRGCFGLMFLQ